MLRDHLENKEEIRQELFLLKLIAFLVPIFIGMKKRMKVSHLSTLLPHLTGKLNSYRVSAVIAKVSAQCEHQPAIFT